MIAFVMVMMIVERIHLPIESQSDKSHQRARRQCNSHACNEGRYWHHISRVFVTTTKLSCLRQDNVEWFGTLTFLFNYKQCETFGKFWAFVSRWDPGEWGLCSVTCGKVSASWSLFFDFVNLNDQWIFLCRPKVELKCCKHLRIQKAGHIFTYLQHWLSFELDVLHLTSSHNNHCSASEGFFICTFFSWDMNLRTKHGFNCNTVLRTAEKLQVVTWTIGQLACF